MVGRWQGAIRAFFGLSTLLLLASTPVSPQTIGFLALAEGNVSLIRGASAYGVSEGVRIQEGDILATAEKSQAQLQLADGTLLNLGPATRFMLAGFSASRGEAEAAMLSGWLKFSQKKSNPPRPYRIWLPNAQVTGEEATAVLHAEAGLAEAFVESGSIKFAELREKGAPASPLVARGGEFVRLKVGQAVASAPRAPLDFINAMPRHFKDPLPLVADKFKDKRVEAKHEHEVTYAEVEDWLKANPSVRKGFVKRFQARARDPEFRSALIKNLREHAEWDRTLFPQKYEKKEKEEPSRVTPK